MDLEHMYEPNEKQITPDGEGLHGGDGAGLQKEAREPDQQLLTVDDIISFYSQGH
ncbi:hypothetical protein [Paenibacillus senegalimassiliensis]|uniref:hypothetical protein n=1 Tax=Paenibacillus senegalimassiliensis TaxID=1737426 RepID=UPI000A75BD05|nr:hypothetical protein [Paenibacillus senegalimassiliensis]